PASACPRWCCADARMPVVRSPATKRWPDRFPVRDSWPCPTAATWLRWDGRLESRRRWRPGCSTDTDCNPDAIAALAAVHRVFPAVHIFLRDLLRARRAAAVLAWAVHAGPYLGAHVAGRIAPAVQAGLSRRRRRKPAAG